MLLHHLPQTLARINAALADWHHTEPEPVALTHRDHEWTQGGEQVRLSVWDSAAHATVTVTYFYGGAQVAHLVLTTPDQVLPWLRIVGAVVPSPGELAEAMLTDTTVVGA